MGVLAPESVTGIRVMLDACQIVAEAERQSGRSDLDGAVLGNLQVLIDALHATAGLSVEGERLTERQFIAETSNRIQAQRWLDSYPDIDNEMIEAPLFLTGLPRSGTTYFQYLFDRDDRYRLIRTWQTNFPHPPPGWDPQSIEARRNQWATMMATRPSFEGFDAMHLYDADGSDECHALLQSSYGAAGLHNLFDVPDYFEHLLNDLDLEQTYRIHQRQLKLFQWRQYRKPWALKYPNHVLAMDTILRVYPDARFLMTHRDPVQTLASICKMTYHLRGMRSAEPVDPHSVGRQMRYFIRRHIDRILAFERGPSADRVIHVDYYALAADPVSALRNIHHRLNLSTPESVERAVSQWFRENPKNARGRNDYAIEQWGLNAEEIAEEYADYIEYFDIPREAEVKYRAAEHPQNG